MTQKVQAEKTMLRAPELVDETTLFEEKGSPGVADDGISDTLILVDHPEHCFTTAALAESISLSRPLHPL